jgi:hypothetical protein
VLAGLGGCQRGLIGFGSTGGNQRRAVVELHLLYRAVRVVGLSSDGDIGEDDCALGTIADILAACGRRCDLDVGCGLVERVVLAEIPYLLTCIYLFLLTDPVAFVLELYEAHLDAVVAWSPDVELGTAETVVVADNAVCSRTAVVVNPGVECWLHAAPVVCCALDMQQGYGT